MRKTFKPLCITSDAVGRLDGALTVPIDNSFSHAVTASVKWQFPENPRSDDASLRQAKDVRCSLGSHHPPARAWKPVLGSTAK